MSQISLIFQRNTVPPFSVLKMEAVCSYKTLVSAWSPHSITTQKINIFTTIRISNLITEHHKIRLDFVLFTYMDLWVTTSTSFNLSSQDTQQIWEWNNASQYVVILLEFRVAPVPTTTPQTHRGRKGEAPPLLNLSTRWGGQLHTIELYPETSLTGGQVNCSHSGHGNEENILKPLTGIKLWSFNP
jgi:hypothetical protein